MYKPIWRHATVLHFLYTVDILSNVRPRSSTIHLAGLSRFAQVTDKSKLCICNLHPKKYTNMFKHGMTKQYEACTWRLWDSSCATQAAPQTFKGCTDIVTPTFCWRATAKTVTSGTYTWTYFSQRLAFREFTWIDHGFNRHFLVTFGHVGMANAT